MAVFQVLAEMVGAEELLCVVALAELVHAGQVLEAAVPVRLREVGELLAAVPACVMGRAGVCLCGGGARGVEGGLVAWEGGAGPGVAAEVEGVLVSFGFVLVLEAVVAELAGVLLFQLVRAAWDLVRGVVGVV